MAQNGWAGQYGPFRGATRWPVEGLTLSLTGKMFEHRKDINEMSLGHLLKGTNLVLREKY